MDALHDVKDGSTMIFSGFGVCGIPEKLIKAIHKKGIKNITAISNDAGLTDFGLGTIISSGQIVKLYASYVGEHKKIAEELATGKLELIMNPQGTVAEKLRAGGAGIPAFYTPAGKVFDELFRRCFFCELFPFA
jgi:acyl CoA:acetate/3-ketoacid CoA transferase alpha subunit